MRFLYVTDIHGNHSKYERTLDAAVKQKCEMIVNGADMYPKNSGLLDQHKFIEGFLDKYFGRCEKAGIAYMAMAGNDDLRVFDSLLDQVCDKHEKVFNIAQRMVDIGGHEFVGFNWVVDYPFRLKDRCRMDDKEYVFGPQFGKGCYSLRLPDGQIVWDEVEDWPEHARGLLTIEDEIKGLPRPERPKDAIYVIHNPPSGLGLDVCTSLEAVGSKAIRRFIEDKQPLFTLHGHIHESPDMSGHWKAPLGRTTCVQPGQMRKASYVVIDTDAGSMDRLLD